MNQTLLDNINRKCDYRDVLYHLGDFYMATAESKERDNCMPPEYYIEQIKPDIIFINGNHDSRKITNSLLEEISVKIGKTMLYCTHIPRAVSKYNLCGHIHDLWRVVWVNEKYIINVGVDMWDYEPISYDEIYQAIQNYKNFFNGKAPRRPKINERGWK